MQTQNAALKYFLIHFQYVHYESQLDLSSIINISPARVWSNRKHAFENPTIEKRIYWSLLFKHKTG